MFSPGIFLRAISAGCLLVSGVLCTTGIMTVQAEEPVSLNGWLTVMWGDDENGASTGPLFQVTEETGVTSPLIISEPVRRSVGDVLALNGKFVGVQGTVAGAQAMAQDGRGALPVAVSPLSRPR